MRRVHLIALAAAASGCFVTLDFSGFDPSRPPIFEDGGSPDAVALGDGSFSRAFAITVPPTLALAARQQASIPVAALRAPGFDRPITLIARSPPVGFTIGTARIEPGMTTALLPITAPAEPRVAEAITVEGTSGNEVSSASIEVTVSPPPGFPDETFAPGGVVKIGSALRDRDNRGMTLFFSAIGADGRIVLVGPMATGVRIADGGPDPDYGDAGTAPYPFGLGVNVDSHGAIGAAGFGDDLGDVRIAGQVSFTRKVRIVRVTRAGVSSIVEVNTEGFGSLASPSGAHPARTLVALSDGGADLRFVSVLGDGGIDPSFGFDASPYAGVRLTPRGLHDAPDAGVFLFGGLAGGDGDLGVLRLTSTGQPVAGFGALAPGLASVDFGGPGACPRAQLFDGSGRVYVAGFLGSVGTCGVEDGPPPPGSLLRVYRLSAQTGAIDPTFGGPDGVRLPPGITAWANAIALQPDGKLLVGGAANISGRARGMILRVLPDGTLDPTFTSAGFAPGVLLPLQSSANHDEVLAVRQVADRIVVAGRSNRATAFIAHLVP